MKRRKKQKSGFVLLLFLSLLALAMMVALRILSPMDPVVSVSPTPFPSPVSSPDSSIPQAQGAPPLVPVAPVVTVDPSAALQEEIFYSDFNSAAEAETETSAPDESSTPAYVYAAPSGENELPDMPFE